MDNICQRSWWHGTELVVKLLFIKLALLFGTKVAVMCIYTLHYEFDERQTRSGVFSVTILLHVISLFVLLLRVSRTTSHARTSHARTRHCLKCRVRAGKTFNIY